MTVAKGRIANSFVVAGFVGAWLGSPANAQQQLTITAPINGTMVTFGQQISIVVAAAPSISPVWVFAKSPLPEVQPTASPTVFLLTIPNNIPAATYQLTAVGGLNGSDIESTPVNIDVEPQFVPDAIQVKPTSIPFTAVKQSIPLRVLSTLNGLEIDLTNSAFTTYSSQNTTVAAVAPNGIVSSVGPGGTDIIVSNSQNPDVAFSVPVRVRLGNAAPEYNVSITVPTSINVGPNGSYIVSMFLTNNSNVGLSSVNISATLNLKSPITSPPAINDIGPGTSRTLNYLFPSSAGLPGASAVLRISGQYFGMVTTLGAKQGGILNMSFTVVL
jgi:hypothetical protein